MIFANANATAQPPPRASPMSSENRYWHKAWTVDLKNQTATHKIGLVVRFARAGEGYDGKPTAESAQRVFEALMREQTQNEAAQRLARLMREAGDAFTYALDRERHNASGNRFPQNPNKPKKIL
jgi:hypothetical protein